MRIVVALLASIVVPIAACGTGVGRGEAAARAETADAGPDAGPSVQRLQLRATSPSGLAVTVHVDSAPVREGPALFSVTVDPAPPEELAVSADLVSPTMPMHGIVRYPATRVGAGLYLVRAEIPMEGRWALYVNLHSDSDTAVVAFDVLGAAGAPGDTGAAKGRHAH